MDEKKATASITRSSSCRKLCPRCTWQRLSPLGPKRTTRVAWGPHLLEQAHNLALKYSNKSPSSRRLRCPQGFQPVSLEMLPGVPTLTPVCKMRATSSSSHSRPLEPTALHASSFPLSSISSMSRPSRRGASRARISVSSRTEPGNVCISCKRFRSACSPNKCQGLGMLAWKVQSKSPGRGDCVRLAGTFCRILHACA